MKTCRSIKFVQNGRLRPCAAHQVGVQNDVARLPAAVNRGCAVSCAGPRHLRGPGTHRPTLRLQSLRVSEALPQELLEYTSEYLQVP